MFGARQTLHLGISSSELQELLDGGSRVVYLMQQSDGSWNSVLERDVVEEVTPEAIVLDFLVHVDPTRLETKMLENPGMGEGPGKVALRALQEMVSPRGA